MNENEKQMIKDEIKNEVLSEIENEAWKYDKIDSLKAHVWDNFKNRTSQEWKISLAFWGAILGLIGIILSKEGHQILTQIPEIFFWILILFVNAIHWYFLWGVSRGHRADRAQEYFFREEIMKKLNLEFPKDVNDKLTAISDRNKLPFFLHWSWAFQIFMTLLLTALLILILRLDNPNTRGNNSNKSIPTNNIELNIN